MKLVLLGDTHFGARGDSEYILEHQEKFYNEIFFPYLKEHNITDVVQLGDLMDRRKYVNFKTLADTKRIFIERFKEYNINLHVFVGNHDSFYKHTIKINSIDQLFKDYDNVHLYEDFTTLSFGNKTFDLVPWMNKENEQEISKNIEKSCSNYVLGHFEFSGFRMAKNVPAQQHGTSSKAFSKYDQVFSGHFHHRSTQGNITYIGTPYELTWSDYDDEKGFTVLDTDNGNIEYIKNPYNLHVKFFYDDSSDDKIEFIKNIDWSLYELTIVKFITIEKCDVKLYEETLKKLQSNELIDLQITDVELSYREIDMEDVEVEDTMTTLIKQCENVDSKNINNDKLTDYIKHYYTEALTLGTNE